MAVIRAVNGAILAVGGAGVVVAGVAKGAKVIVNADVVVDGASEGCIVLVVQSVSIVFDCSYVIINSRS